MGVFTRVPTYGFSGRGDWALGGMGYLGLKFQIGGQTHYGGAALTVYVERWLQRSSNGRWLQRNSDGLRLHGRSRDVDGFPVGQAADMFGHDSTTEPKPLHAVQ
jgi:hypothetical protein